MEIRGESTLDAGDLADGLRALPTTRRTRWILLAGGICALLSGFFSRSPGIQVVLGVLALAFAALLPYLLRLNARRAIAGKAPGELLIRYLVDDEGYRGESSNRSARVLWSALYGWLETPRTFCLQTAPQLYEMLPKRAFTEADQAAVRSLLQQHIVSRKVPRSKYWIFFVCSVLVLLFFSFYSLFSRHR